MMESGELVVRYRARRTYSRRTTEATCEFLYFGMFSEMTVVSPENNVPKPASVPRLDNLT